MTAKTLLFDDLPKEKDDIHTLKLNDKYLASFNARKRKEALAKEAARFRDENSASESSSTSEEEDSDAELLTKEVQAKILTTLSKIKSKDATIYDKEKKFFNEEDFQEKDTKKKTVKPLTFSRFMSKTLVKEGAEAFTRQEDELNQKLKTPSSCFEKEQIDLKNDFLKAAYNDDDGDDNDDFLIVKEKSEQEKEQDEISFLQFLQKRSQNNKSESTLLEQYLKDDQEMDPNQKFLRDYVIFEGWKEGNKMPQSGKEGYDVEPMNEEEEEAYLNESNKFEALYNFRYEEQPSCSIQGYAREVYDSVRQKEDKRKKKRLERKIKKEKEKEAKKKELEELKKMKKEEILERLKLIQKVSGCHQNLDADVVDLNGDFDEEEHEKHMEAILGDNFENQPDDENLEIGKVSAEIDTLLNSLDTKIPKHLSAKKKRKLEKLQRKKQKMQQALRDDEPYAPLPEGEINDEDISQPELSVEEFKFNQDAQQDNHLWFLCDRCHSGIPVGKKKYECSKCDDFILCNRCYKNEKHEHFMKSSRVPEGCDPILDLPSSITLKNTYNKQTYTPEIEKALKEYEALNYEDIVGGIPTRFKYRETQKTNYGMSTEEILNRTNSELNQRVSLKQLAPYRAQNIYHKKNKSNKVMKAKEKVRVSSHIKQNSASASLHCPYNLSKTIPEDRLAAYGLDSV